MLFYKMSGMPSIKNISIFLCIFWVLSSCSSQESTKTTSGAINISPPKKYNATIDDNKKVELAKERLKEANSIRKGDYMMAKNNPKEALGYYLPILEKLPNDIVLHKKMANAYFLLKDWNSAYTHYIFVPLGDLSPAEKKNMIFSLFYDENFVQKRWELDKFEFTEEERAYYNFMADCYNWIDACRESSMNYSWADSRINDIKKLITEASKLSPENSYKNILLAKALYEQKMYRLSGMFSYEILQKNPSYMEAKKMRAFSLFELGKYSDAREILSSYLEQNPNDLEVIIRLWEASTYLGDYTNANLYLNNAIIAGYTPKTLLERRLAYNYSKLWDTQWMMNVLSYLLQEADVKEDDYAVAISLALEKSENTRAYAWAYQWVQKFPNSKVLTPLYIQSLRLNNKIPEAASYISTLPQDMLSLPMVQLEHGIILFANQNYNDAKAIFSTLMSIDENADFALEAASYMTAIENYERSLALSSWSVTTQSGSVESGTTSTTETSFWDL